MSPWPIRLALNNWSFPRVSGDEPPAHTLGFLISEFSPRERG